MASSHNPSSATESNHESFFAPGYPRLAYWFSRYRRYFHVRRFCALSKTILLYKQHRIAILETNMREMERKLQYSDPASLTDFSRLTSERHEFYAAAYLELKEYEEAVIRSRQLDPISWNQTGLRKIQRWLAQMVESTGLPPLMGIESGAWGTQDNPSGHALDMIQVFPEPEGSLFDQLPGGGIFQWHARDSYGQYGYNSHSLRIFSNAASVIIIVFLPTLQAFGYLNRSIAITAVIILLVFTIFGDRENRSIHLAIMAVMLALLQVTQPS